MDKNNQKDKIKDELIQNKKIEKLTDEELDKVSGGIGSWYGDDWGGPVPEGTAVYDG